MKRSVSLTASAGACLVLLACATQGPPSGLVISDVTVVSPERDAPLEHASVRIVDGRIAEVSERRLRGEQEVDGSGRYLIPGLIDTHVHLAIAPGFPAPMTPEIAAANPDIVAAALAQDPKSFLFFGFTTVLDLIGTGERTAQWNVLELRPDAYFCGLAAILDGQVRVGVAPRFSYGRGPQVDPAMFTPETAVARIADDGAICVKTVHDALFPLTLEQGLALVAAAHARDLPVLIHANRKAAQGFAVAAGMDVIVHGMWQDKGEAAALDDEAREILAAIARDDIGYQPTTQVVAGQGDMFDVNYLTRPELADAYPAVLTDWYRRVFGALVEEQVRISGAEAAVRLRETLDRAAEVTAILNESDARLLFGSDTPSDMIYSNPPGLNGRLEMNHWIAAGVSEEKLFRALTIENARMMHLDDEIGTVEAGKTANLLLLGGNPLESVEAYDAIETVFLHGRPIARETLSARKAE